MAAEKNEKKKKLNPITAFDVVNTIVLALLALACLLPFVNTVALSFSSKSIASTGTVTFWPKEFTVAAYGFVLKKAQFWNSMLISLERVVLGTLFNLAMIILSAYPLSRPRKDFRAQPYFMWYMFIPMIFSGGIIPTYMIVRATGIMNTIWSLIFPVGLPVFNMILLMNFFRQLPHEIDEAAFVDGANHWQILFRITLPLTKPAIATITLLVFVFHWNSWFDGMIYTTDVARYPLQTYIRSVTTLPDVTTLSMEQVKLLQLVSDKTMRSAQIVICSVPVLLVYPFLQRYFVKGLVLGGVKG